MKLRNVYYRHLVLLGVKSELCDSDFGNKRDRHVHCFAVFLFKRQSLVIVCLVVVVSDIVQLQELSKRYIHVNPLMFLIMEKQRRKVCKLMNLGACSDIDHQEEYGN